MKEFFKHNEDRKWEKKNKSDSAWLEAKQRNGDYLVHHNTQNNNHPSHTHYPQSNTSEAAIAEPSKEPETEPKCLATESEPDPVPVDFFHKNLQQPRKGGRPKVTDTDQCYHTLHHI